MTDDPELVRLAALIEIFDEMDGLKERSRALAYLRSRYQVQTEGTGGRGSEAHSDLMRGWAADRREKGLPLGAKPKLSPVQLTEAEKLLRVGDMSVKDIAKQLGVSVGTLYNHFPGGRAGLSESK